MNKFVIVTDIDGCINNLIEQMFKRYNDSYGTNYSINDMKSYNFDDNFSLEASSRMKMMLLEKDLWDSLTPVEGAQFALQSFINSGHKVYVATSTHHVNFPWKVEWMKKFFPFIDEKNIICINDKSLLRCDVLIEDCYSNLTKSMCERVLINKPWNQIDKDYIYGINRAYNWEEVVRFVNKIYKEMEW